MRYERDGFSVRAAQKKKRPLPPDHWYLNQPPDLPGSDFFYIAFRDLQTCRAPDGPIPWDKAMAYADRKELPADVAGALWCIVRKIDNAERSWRLEQLEAESGNGGLSGRRGN